MAKRLLSVLAALLCAVLFISCASAPTAADGERAMATALAGYRSAALVVRGKCVSEHIDASDAVCSDVSVTEVVAGTAQVGDTIHCPGAYLHSGESYLLYLSEGADVDYAEDERGYTLLSSMLISGDSVDASGVQLSYRELRSGMRDVDSVTSAFDSYYYYTSIAELAENADEVFIGRVDGKIELTDTDFHVTGTGTSSEFTLPASILQITSFGGMKGSIGYGDSVKLVYAPAFSADIINASTLTAVKYGESDAPALTQGGVYVFFMIYGPDAKQDYMFLINPMQGFVQTDENSVSVSTVNSPLRCYTTLNSLVDALRGEING